jgi:hypothetical protein
VAIGGGNPLSSSLAKILRDPTGEKDVFAQTVALTGTAGWLNRVCINELVEREGASKCLRVVDNGDDDPTPRRRGGAAMTRGNIIDVPLMRPTSSDDDAA